MAAHTIAGKRLSHFLRLLSYTLLHLVKNCLATHLLIAYLLAGIASGFIYGGILRTLANYALLTFYVLIIRMWTRHDHPTVAVRGSHSFRRDMLLIVIAICIAGLYALLFWNYFGKSANFPSVIQEWMLKNLTTSQWNHSLAGIAANGLPNMLFLFVPLLTITFALGYRPRHVGLVPRRLGLGFFLVALGVAFAWLAKWAGVNSTPVWHSTYYQLLVLASTGLMIFVNGLPEEFIFRGVILSRLLPWFKRPGNVLVISSILFVYSHVPSLVQTAPPNIPRWLILLGLLVSPGPMPTGLAWSYLFYRTRSIWPGVLWHSSFMTIGLLFFPA